MRPTWCRACRSSSSSLQSHSTAAAELLSFQGVKLARPGREGLPEVVLIGGLEARIYRCECGKDIHLWDIAGGTRVWAGAEGLKVNTEARVLRGPWERPTQSEPPMNPSTELRTGADGHGSPSASGVQIDVGANKERLEFSQYGQAIDAGRPVVLTYSLDEGSARDMRASFRSQQRVSVLGVGYQEGNPSRHVIALVPQGAEKDKRLQQLATLPGVRKGDREDLLLIPWDLQAGNLIARFINSSVIVVVAVLVIPDLQVSAGGIQRGDVPDAAARTYEARG